MSRAQTLVLALLVLHLLLGALSLVIGRGEHRSAALRWWGWGLLVYAAGLLVTILGILGPKALMLTLGNALITAAPVLCALGVLAHARHALNLKWVSAGVGVTIALLAANNFTAAPTPLVNLIAPTVMAVAMFLLAAWVLVRDGPAEARIANQFLAGMMVLAVATWLARIAMMLSGGARDPAQFDAIISFFAIAQMVNGVGATLALFWIDVRLMQSELSRIANSDSLTDVPNRRAILARFGEEVARASRHGGRFALALFDIDRFKQVNDRHGHIAGDLVLQEVARALGAAKRADDVLGRLGGEEFVVLLHETTREGALEAAERLRVTVSRAAAVSGGHTLRATVSGGVALYPDDGDNWDSLFGAADRRLYEAKRGGRDRVEANG